MNCQEFQELLDAALDERRVITGHAGSVGDVDSVAHAELCPDCRLLYEEHALIVSALSVWAPRRPVVDLSERIIESARREGLISSVAPAPAVDVPAPPVGVNSRGGVANLDVRPGSFPKDETFSRTGRSNVWPTVVTVALVLIAVTVVFREKPRQIVHDEKQPIPLSPDPQSDSVIEPQDQLADIGHLVADARLAWQGIARRVSYQASGLSVFVPDLGDELGISDAAESLDMIREKPGEKNDPQPSEPSAVRKAFEFFFDEDAADARTI